LFKKVLILFAPSSNCNLPCSIAAASVVVFNQGRFLLIERKYPPYQGWLSFPGGKVEPQEKPLEAAKRELYEETALIAKELKLLATMDLYKEGEAIKRTLLNVYQALATQGTPRPGDDANAIFWYDVAQMQKFQVIPSVLAVAKQLTQAQVRIKTNDI